MELNVNTNAKSIVVENNSDNIEASMNAKTIVVTNPVNNVQVTMHTTNVRTVTPAVDTVIKTEDYTMTALNSLVLCDATSASLTITLPTAVGIAGKYYTIKKIDITTNTVTVDGNGSETIDGETTQIIQQKNVSITVVSNGINWLII